MSHCVTMQLIDVFNSVLMRSVEQMNKSCSADNRQFIVDFFTCIGFVTNNIKNSWPHPLTFWKKASMTVVKCTRSLGATLTEFGNWKYEVSPEIWILALFTARQLPFSRSDSSSYQGWQRGKDRESKKEQERTGVKTEDFQAGDNWRWTEEGKTRKGETKWDADTGRSVNR